MVIKATALLNSACNVALQTGNIPDGRKEGKAAKSSMSQLAPPHFTHWMTSLFDLTFAEPIR